MVFTLQSFALRPFALDTVKAVPPYQGGSIHQAILFAGRVIEKSIWRPPVGRFDAVRSAS